MALCVEVDLETTIGTHPFDSVGAAFQLKQDRGLERQRRAWTFVTE